ncbi:MAG: HD-like signal output (HDOD) protein [Myxococcota bacterium]|jgi:HD-like signal output (HDOD) protein
MIEKMLHQSEKMEFGAPKAALVDRLAYDIRSEIKAGGSAAPLLEDLLNAVRCGDFRLPILPESVTRVMHLINRSDADIGAIALAVELDPTLAVKVVGVANSVYYGGVQPADSVRNALMRMGLAQARNVVVAVALRSSLFRVSGYASEMQSIWLHSLFCALTCDAILEEVPPFQDAGFLLGLSHDVGRIAVLSFVSEMRLSAAPGLGPSTDIIDRVSSRVHERLGAIAVESWGFSAEFTEAIGHHHDPDKVSGHGIVLARALAAGDILADRIGGTSDGAAELLCEKEREALECVGVEGDAGIELVGCVRDRFEALSKMV